MKNYNQNHLTRLCQIMLIMVFGVFLSSCGPSEKERLQSKVDSLQNELRTSEEMSRTLNEISVLMDSIDVNRESLRINTFENSSRKNYVGLMQNLNKYVKDTEDKIQRIEDALKKSKSSVYNLSATVKKLKSDLESRSVEIASLKETIEKYKTDNQNLTRITEEQGVAILEKQNQIQTKTNEVTSLTQKIDEVISSARISEANSYYAQAEAVEEIANRTRLAPKKKKSTMNESLTLYRKALSLGNPNAKVKIEQLEKELN